MQRRAVSWCAVGFAAGVCAFPSAAPAISDEPPESESEVWAPALGAWGARAAAVNAQAAPAPPLEAGALGPALVSVGQDAADAVADALPAPTRDETQRWVPAFALQSGVLGQEAEGSVDSDSTVTYEYLVRQRPTGQVLNTVGRLVVTRSLREGKDNYLTFQGGGANGRPTAFTPGLRPPSANQGPRTPVTSSPNGLPPPGCLPGERPQPCTGGMVLPVTGDNLLLTPLVGLSTEIMSPGLQEVALRPRLFLHTDASLAFSQTRSVGREGVPEGVALPPDQSIPSETEVSGVGSITDTEVKTLLVSGGLGVAFTIDAFERRLRIKPSVEYVREKIKVTGKLTRAFKVDTGLGTAQPPAVFVTQPIPADHPAVFLPIDLESSDELTAYGIGPGLEIETDAARAGPFMLSVFLSGQAYRMLGDRDLHLTDTAQIEVPDDNPNTPAVQDVSADWDFHKHAWSYRGGLGVRFRWLPEGQ